MNLAASRSARLKNKLVMRLGCVLVAVGFLVSSVVTPRARAVAVVDDVAVGAMSCAAFLESIGLSLTATSTSTALVPVGITAVAGEYAAATGAAASGEAFLGTVAAGTAVSTAGTIILTAAAVAAIAGLAYWLYQKSQVGDATLLDAYMVSIDGGVAIVYPNLDSISAYMFCEFDDPYVETETVYKISERYSVVLYHLFEGSREIFGWRSYDYGGQLNAQGLVCSTFKAALYCSNATGNINIACFRDDIRYLYNTKIPSFIVASEKNRVNIGISNDGYLDIPDIFENQLNHQMEITVPSAAPGSTLAELVETVPQQVVDGTLSATYTIDTVPPSPPSISDGDVEDVDDLGLPSLGEALTRRFPFSIPWDIARGFTLLAAPAKAPYFEVDFYEVIGDRVGGWKRSTKLVLDFSEYEILGRLSRWTSTIGFCLFLRRQRSGSSGRPRRCTVWDALTSTLTAFAVHVINLLPESPFVILDELSRSEFYEWLQFLNWFIPVNTFVSILEGWLVAVAIYYVYQIVLRWVKVIE